VHGSDCAAEVIAVGDAVSKFVVGDHVAPTIDLFNLTGHERRKDSHVLGGDAPGTLREYAIFEEKFLVRLPKHLSWEEAATLTCTGITAWVSLGRLQDVPEGSTAMIQGTGGVSLSALLLCIAAGIKPIITSSSDEKLANIKKLHPSVEGLNYKTCPDVVAEVLKLTQGNGVDFVINNVGAASIPDDLAVIRKQGTIAFVGVMGGFSGSLSNQVLLGLIHKACKIQGILAGSRADFEAMNHYIEKKGVRFESIVDRVFEFDKAPAALEYIKSFQHTGKVVIKI